MPSQSQSAFLPTRAVSTIEVDGGSELESFLLTSQSQSNNNVKNNAQRSQLVDDSQNNDHDNDKNMEGEEEESVNIGKQKKNSQLKKKSAMDRKFGSDSSDGEDHGLSSYL